VYSITTVNSITSTIAVVTMKIWSVSLNLEVFTHNLGSSFANERTVVVLGLFALARLQEH